MRTFVFCTTKFIPLSPGRFQCVSFTETAPTFEEACAAVEPKVAEGHRIWTWWEENVVASESEEG